MKTARSLFIIFVCGSLLRPLHTSGSSQPEPVKTPSPGPGESSRALHAGGAAAATPDYSAEDKLLREKRPGSHTPNLNEKHGKPGVEPKTDVDRPGAFGQTKPQPKLQSAPKQPGPPLEAQKRPAQPQAEARTFNIASPRTPALHQAGYHSSMPRLGGLTANKANIQPAQTHIPHASPPAQASGLGAARSLKPGTSGLGGPALPDKNTAALSGNAVTRRH